MAKIIFPKRPSVLTNTPSKNNMTGLSQAELLVIVKQLHNQLLKTNDYLMKVHKLAIYNYDDTDTDSIMVEVLDNKKGFLLDNVLKLRGMWDPKNNMPELEDVDMNKIGWLYKVNVQDPVQRFGTMWKNGDYVMYDENGTLYNVSTDLLKSVFIPVIGVNSDTIALDIQSSSSGTTVKADLILDDDPDNDLIVTDRGLYSDAYKRASKLIGLLTEAPTEDYIGDGLMIVHINEAPETYYNGYLYLIPAVKEYT